jgi:hypothetical protein
MGIPAVRRAGSLSGRSFGCGADGKGAAGGSTIHHGRVRQSMTGKFDDSAIGGGTRKWIPGWFDD